MQIKEFLNKVSNQIKYKPIKESLLEELKEHIEEKKENYIITKNINENLAEEKAIEEMGDPSTIGKELNKIHRPKLEWKLFIITIILLCFGFLIFGLKNAEYVIKDGELGLLTKYIVFLITGVLLGTIVYFSDYKKIIKYSKWIYLITTILIIYILNTNQNIIDFDRLRLTSIIAIPLYLISFVGFICNTNTKKMFNIIKIILLSIFTLILMLKLENISSFYILSISYLILTSVKLWKTDIRYKRYYIIFLWIIPIAILAIAFLSSGSYRIDRVISIINPESDPNGRGWDLIQKKEILSTANFFGKSENMNLNTNLFDDAKNYAIISILLNYGWGVIIIMILSVFAFCTLMIIDATKIKDTEGKLIIIAISLMFILQNLFNILMNFNLGIQGDFTIPLVSYGEIELIVNIVSLSLIFSIYRKKNIFSINSNDKIKDII